MFTDNIDIDTQGICKTDYKTHKLDAFISDTLYIDQMNRYNLVVPEFVTQHFRYLVQQIINFDNDIL